MKTGKKLLSIALSLVMAMAFGACSTEGDESLSESGSQSSASVQDHVHAYGEAWKTSPTYHWHECTCGSRMDTGKHAGEAVSCIQKAHCEICGVEFGEFAQHVGEATSCDKKPTCEVCGEEFGEPADHTYGELTDIGDGVMGYDCSGCDNTIPFLSEEKNGEFVEGVIDFVVDVEEGRDPVVLQLSDTQLCNWGSLENSCFTYIREAVAATNPDLILLTGDIVYGCFDKDGALLLELIAFMESLEIYWAPVFGNHDNECWLGVDWQCEQLENAQYCLFEQRDLTGNGNYSVGITQGGKLLRVFYMLDSNGCSAPMCAGPEDKRVFREDSKEGENVVKSTAGFATTQIDWYNNSIKTLKLIVPDVKISFAFHIQIEAFLDAFEKYEEYDGKIAAGSSSALKNPVNLDTLEGAEEGDFGYIGRVMKGAWDGDYAVFNNLKELGVDSIFVGHEHCNSASIVLDGIRFQYGQKSSTYDRYNVLMTNGKITDSGSGSGTPIMGGSVIPLSQEDGSIVNPYIYICGDILGTNP